MSSRLVYAKTLFVCVRNHSTNSGKNVAFLGLGNMGQHMATNLTKKGFKVKGYDISADVLKAVSSLGIEPATSIKECVKNAQYVVTALPNNAIVRKAYLSNDGIIENAEKDALLLDTSTVEPVVSQEVSEAAKKKGISFIDSPMSGGVMGAQNATLCFMVGGSVEDFNKSEPVLSAMGARKIHCGDIGSGEVAKLCNNLLLAGIMHATSECLNLGIEKGLDPQALMDVINSSSGRSWVSEVYCPIPGLVPTVPSSLGYKGGFKLDLVVKDLTLASNMINSCKAPATLGAMTTQYYKTMQTKGHGDKDFSYIYKFMRE